MIAIEKQKGIDKTLVVKIKQYDYSEACPECMGNIISIKVRGEIVCSQCGLIIEERKLDINHSGIRAFNEFERSKKERTGKPITPLLSDKGLCTFIDKNSICNPDLKRAVILDSQLPWGSRNLLIATNEIKRLSHILNLPFFAQVAILKLYRKSFNAHLLRGRSILGMVAACVYYVCKEKNIPRAFQDIINKTSIKYKPVKRSYNILVKSLKLKTPAINPTIFIPRYIADLGLKNDIEALSIKIIKRYRKVFSTCGIDPRGLCAGAIYLAIKIRNIRISQKHIAKTIGVTEVTLRSRYKELFNSIVIELDFL